MPALVKKKMSSAPYVSMATPKRGLKTIDGRSGVEYAGRPFEQAGTLLSNLLMGKWDTIPAMVAGIWALRTLMTMIFVFLGSFVYGFVFVFAQSNAATVGTDLFIRYVLLGLVAAVMFYVTSVWTYYPDLPTIIYPAHSLSLIATGISNPKMGSFGAILALVYGVFQFSGYAAAGGLVKALNVTATLQNTAGPVLTQPGSAATYWLYWFGATVIAFSYVFNRLFRQEGESVDRTANDRGSVAAALAIFGFTVAFHLLGLNSYSSGVYVTQSIVSNGAYPVSHVGDTVVQWAFYIFVDLLAVPGTVALLTIVVYMTYRGADVLEDRYKVDGTKINDNDGGFTVPNNAQVAGSASQRILRRNLTVNY